MEPKSIKNPLKIHPKIEVRKRTAQNREKSRPGSPKSRKCRCECLARVPFLGRWGPYNEGKKDCGLCSSAPTRRWRGIAGELTHAVTRYSFNLINYKRHSPSSSFRSFPQDMSTCRSTKTHSTPWGGIYINIYNHSFYAGNMDNSKRYYNVVIPELGRLTDLTRGSSLTTRIPLSWQAPSRL